jgi:hypothetical protein
VPNGPRAARGGRPAGRHAYHPRADAHSGQAPPSTAAQQDLIARAHAVAAADSRIVAAWLGGSFAAGTADAYSDIDLNCAITDESADWFTAHWDELARQITPERGPGSAGPPTSSEPRPLTWNDA